uniref:TORC_M domain-containing protein n=1 Tax=Rhabditophanes sp. KR3021 TaxID=114890 RepID=A0AC35U7A6_9BILA
MHIFIRAVLLDQDLWTFQQEIKDLKTQSTLSKKNVPAPAASPPTPSIPRQTTGRNAALGLHPETLQHAAAGLRKTIHGQQILSCEGHEPSGRPDQLPSPGNWENFEGNDKLQQSPPRKPILATGSSSHFNSPISVRDLHAYPLTMQPKHYYEEVFYSPPNNNNNNNGPNLTSADIQSIYDSSSSYKNNNVSPPPNSFYHQSPTPLRQPILTTTSNYGKSQHNDSIPIPIKINNSSHLIQSTPLNTNNNTHSEHSNRYEAYALNNNPAKQDNIFGVNGVVKHQAKTEYFRQDNSPLQSGYIKDPKHYIHQFATKTPIGSLFHNETQRPDGSSSHQFASSSSPTTVNKRGQRERSFAEELRDSSLTERQKYSNKFQKTLLQDNPLPRSFNNFHQTNFLNRGSDELNDLIRDMQIQMSTNTKNTTKTFTTMGESEISSSTMRNHHGPADHPIDSSLKKIPRTDCKYMLL